MKTILFLIVLSSCSHSFQCQQEMRAEAYCNDMGGYVISVGSNGIECGYLGESYEPEKI